MQKYDDPGNNFRLLGEDCFLLEVLLQTLAALFRGAAPYPCPGVTAGGRPPR